MVRLHQDNTMKAVGETKKVWTCPIFGVLSLSTYHQYSRYMFVRTDNTFNYTFKFQL
jgi:hypothetical protein